MEIRYIPNSTYINKVDFEVIDVPPLELLRRLPPIEADNLLRVPILFIWGCSRPNRGWSESRLRHMGGWFGNEAALFELDHWDMSLDRLNCSYIK